MPCAKFTVFRKSRSSAANLAMASFEDYDEFGNYIGADLDSDEEDGPLQQQDLASLLSSIHNTGVLYDLIRNLIP